MKKNILLIWTVFVFVIFYSCSDGQSQTKKMDLIPVEFQEKIKTTPGASLIDVRTPEEYRKGHLEKAVNIDWNGNSFEDQISTLDTLKPVLLYCLSGGRSGSAANKMRSMGFKEVYELKGGIAQWRNAGFSEITEASSKSSGMSRMQYDSLLVSDKWVLVDFYATWCAPCKKMEVYLNEMDKEMTKKVKVVRIDADQNQFLFKDLKIEAIPMLLLYKDKNLEWSKAGYVEKEEVVEQLK